MKLSTSSKGMLVLTLPLVLLAGCVSESVSGQRHEFAYSWWVSGELFVVGLVLTVGGAVATFTGWKFHTSKARGAWIVMILFGLIVTLGVAPSTFLYRVAVDQNGFSIRSGVWGQSIRSMKFASFAQIKLISKIRSRGRGGSSTNYFLGCEGKSGSVEELPLHDGVWSFVGTAALPLIKDNASKHGVAFVNETSFRFPSR